jgi:hypothetical protein
MALGNPRISTREGGHLLELSEFSLNFPGGFNTREYITLHRNGFRNIAGEPLDHDYTIPLSFCDGCITGVVVSAVLPASGQAVPDPQTPFSIYFSQGMDTKTFEASLLGPDGTPLTPLTFQWDTEDTYLTSRGSPGSYLHLTVDHPPLAPNPRPYLFKITQAYRGDHYPLSFNSNLPQSGLRITVGPALAGDLNNDGYVDVRDVTAALRGSLGLTPLSDAQTFAADLIPREGTNGQTVGDGKVDVADVTHILQRAVGLIPDAQWP